MVGKPQTQQVNHVLGLLQNTGSSELWFSQVQSFCFGVCSTPIGYLLQIDSRAGIYSWVAARRSKFSCDAQQAEEDDGWSIACGGSLPQRFAFNGGKDPLRRFVSAHSDAGL